MKHEIKPPLLHEAVDALMSGRNRDALIFYRALVKAEPAKEEHRLILQLLEKQEQQ